MCGINGIIQFKQKLSTEEINLLINKMNNNIVHRGPDEDGVFVHGPAGLGMRRLSIIDLKTGRQPIFNENKTLVIVLNGEVYNYKALREDLMAKGHHFSTASDTEVVLHCYEEYGVESFDMLIGMFVFAIYDLTNEAVVLVRDRSGEKPLYYYNDSSAFYFASELKSIISTALNKKQISKKALNQYLLLTYIPAPLTIFEDVYKLLPGHYMQISLNGAINTEQYWDLQYNPDLIISDYGECKKKLRETLFNAVEDCMVSDVPIGAFLSGGIDSTIITGIMSHISGKPVNTFTIGYKDKEHDESYKAQVVSNYHKTNHHLHYLDYKAALPELNKILGNIDEPFADSSLIPTYMVSKFASQYVKCVLTGDAGDELFGGYNRYLIGFYTKQYNKIPKWLRNNFINKVVYAIPDNKYFMQKARKVVNNAHKSPFGQHQSLMCLGFKQEELKMLLQDNWLDFDSTEFIKDYYMSNNEIEDDLIRAFYTDFKVTLEGDMLPKVDRASMLCSLETRTPLLHKDVIELTARIPTEYKINSRETKIIMKDTFKDLIPGELLAYGKKGFTVPIEKWLREELKNDLLAELSQERIKEQGIFNNEYIKIMIDEHLSQRRNFYSELWTLYVFQVWHKKYFEKANL